MRAPLIATTPSGRIYPYGQTASHIGVIRRVLVAKSAVFHKCQATSSPTNVYRSCSVNEEFAEAPTPRQFFIVASAVGLPPRNPSRK